MNKPATILCIAFAGLFARVAPVAAATPDVRAAVARAVPYVEKQGQWWVEEKKCVSCHRVAFTTWALSQASKRGIDVDRQRLAELRRFSRDHLFVSKKEGEPPAGASNLEGVSQFLLAERPHGAELVDEELRAAFVGFLTAKQRDDGAWDAGGQLPGQKRPKAETELVSTMWNALALGTVDGPAAAESRNKALAAIEKTTDGASTEWYAVRLLLALQSHSDADADATLDKLRSLQRADGSWAWTTDGESDALATGQALYAIRQSGVAADDPMVQRAVKFLLGSQNDDGSWTVLGTKEKKKTEPAETASYWGTCWAVLGLVSTLEEPQ